MDTNDADIDAQIMNYIAEKGFVRTGELIDNLARKDPKDGESKETEAGENNKKSRRTIQRRLKMMKKPEGSIVVPTSEQLKKYGIENPDGRATYLTLRETIERDKDFDTIINLLNTGDNIDKKMVLREINRCKEYILHPSQLDYLVSNLDNEDAELTEGFLVVLHQYITKKKIKPQDKKKILVKKLKEVLKRYPNGHEKRTMIRTCAIRLLGDYDDKAVIEQLIKDCDEGRLSKFKHDYNSWAIAKAVKKERKKLFDLENRLRREGDTVTSDALSDLRDKAEETLKTQKEKDELLKSGARETGEEPDLGKPPNYFHMLQN